MGMTGAVIETTGAVGSAGGSAPGCSAEAGVARKTASTVAVAVATPTVRALDNGDIVDRAEYRDHDVDTVVLAGGAAKITVIITSR